MKSILLNIRKDTANYFIVLFVLDVFFLLFTFRGYFIVSSKVHFLGADGFLSWAALQMERLILFVNVLRLFVSVHSK